MESSLSCLSSLKDGDNVPYVQPHYKESYRLAIYALLCGGKEAYEEFLRAEQLSHFLSEEEILFVLENAELPEVEEDSEGRQVTDGVSPSTYFPTESDVEVPDLDLGWPGVSLEGVDTSISLLFHPPQHNTPTIKEVVRKQIQEARQVVAIAMDVFTDVDIFKELITATLRGVIVYILLDESHFKSFLTMSHRLGVNVHDFKNIRVRTVRGQQYQCRSGLKFHGGLEQKFILVDCQTVLYGSYSYTWSYEKINLSMVLVITGQLACSYDEEFRRLYARSMAPAVLSREKSFVRYLRENVTMQSPNSSQLSLNQIDMRSRVMYGMRSAQGDRFNNAAMLTRGLSMQERLHQSHCPDMGNLVRGHSYGGELQKLNSMSRLRMGTKDIGGPVTPERTGSNLRAGDLNRLSQQHRRHRTLYGADQNLIPFNSETSLHRWKMDAYLNDNNVPLDASCDALSPVTSPYSSLTGLNEHQSQMIHSRSRDIKSRMEEMRQKRLSLQEYTNLRQSQESLRSMYQPLERSKYMSSLRGLDVRQSLAELEPNTQNGSNVELANHKDAEPEKDGSNREQILTDGHRSASHFDVKTAPDRKTMQTYDWHEPLSRTTSAAELEMKLNDPSLKLSHLQPGGLNPHQRVMESLSEIPEEKEGTNSHLNSSDSAVFKEGNEEIHKDETVVPKENSVKSSLPAEPQHLDQTRGGHGSVVQVANSSGSADPREGRKPASNEVQTSPKILNSSAGSQHAAEIKSSPTEKAQGEESTLQRKNSMRMKVYSLFTSDENKATKKEEKSLQRKASLRSQNPSGSNHSLRADHSHASAVEQMTKKGHSPSTSRAQKSSSGATETEKQKSPFLRLSPLRSSKKKANVAAEQDGGSGSNPKEEGASVYHRDKVYSRFEYFLNNDSIAVDKPARTHPSEKERGSSLNRHDSGYSAYQSQSGTDNKLGRFMQRVGSLITKNK